MLPRGRKNYSVPVNGFWEGLFVNKDVLEACGVAVPDANTTWDQFMEMCETIKGQGLHPRLPPAWVRSPPLLVRGSASTTS